MKNPATFRRTAAAVGLVATAILSLASTILAPEFPTGAEERLRAIEAGGTAATVSALAFTLAQLPFIAAVLGIGHLLRDRTPLLSNLGTSLAVVGAFGHSVYGGLSMVLLEMSDDSANIDVHAGILTDVEAGPAVAFMAMGLVGTVLGLLLLSIGIWRGRVGPRWLAPAFGTFLVVEFAGSALSDWSAYVSTLIYGVLMVSLAAVVWRSPETMWQLRREVADAPDPAHLTSVSL